MYVIFSLLLCLGWYIAVKIYVVGGWQMSFVLLLALMSIGCHLETGWRSRKAWKAAQRIASHGRKTGDVVRRPAVATLAA